MERLDASPAEVRTSQQRSRTPRSRGQPRKIDWWCHRAPSKPRSGESQRGEPLRSTGSARSRATGIQIAGTLQGATRACLGLYGIPAATGRPTSHCQTEDPLGPQRRHDHHHRRHPLRSDGAPRCKEPKDKADSWREEGATEVGTRQGRIRTSAEIQQVLG
jgi:hypothetical protein